MTKYVIDLWMDGYETAEEHDAACVEFIKDQLDFAGSSVNILIEKGCKRCKGAGLLYREPDCQDYLGDYVAKDCPDCKGTGAGKR